MQLYLFIILIVVFLVSIFLAKEFRDIPIMIFASIIAIVLGGLAVTEGIELPVGLNTTISEDKTLVTSNIIFEPINPIYSNGLALTFFILVIYAIVEALIMRNMNRSDKEE